MPTNLVPQTSRDCMTGILSDHFFTFSQVIVVNKEPKKEVSFINTPSLPGYSSRRQEISETLIPVSGKFHALVNYVRDNQKLRAENERNELMARTPEGNVLIKTTGEAKDYIINGKTENILVDGKTYNVTSSYQVQKFLGLDYYYFELTETN